MEDAHFDQYFFIRWEQTSYIEELDIDALHEELSTDGLRCGHEVFVEAALERAPASVKRQSVSVNLTKKLVLACAICFSLCEVLSIPQIWEAASSKFTQRATSHWAEVEPKGKVCQPDIVKVLDIEKILNQGKDAHAIGLITFYMCQGLNSHYFHIIGDGHQPNSRGLYTHYKDSCQR